VKVVLVADGACKPNPGSGGWACLLRCGTVEKVLSGGQKETTTNNRMELLAVICGFEALTRPVEVEVFTDSQYIVQAFGKNWLKKWQKNGWMTNAGPVKNQDLWQRLLLATATHKIRWTWVRGHSGHEDNERVDTLAQNQALAYKDLT
jgi:ribonuclease HI